MEGSFPSRRGGAEGLGGQVVAQTTESGLSLSLLFKSRDSA